MRSRLTPNPDVAAALMAQANGHGRLLWHESRPWASANFTGSRDEVAFEYFGREAATIGDVVLAALPDLEFQLEGRTVADATVLWHHRHYRPDQRLVVAFELLLVKD